MNVNTQLAVATHALVFLAHFKDGPQSSALIASSIGTNPVVVRKMMQKLEQHGLVKSVAGSKGGLLLAKPARAITLLQVFEAVNGKEIFSAHSTSHPKCPVGSQMNDLLHETFSSAEKAMRVEFAKKSIADCLATMTFE